MGECTFTLYVAILWHSLLGECAICAVYGYIIALSDGRVQPYLLLTRLSAFMLHGMTLFVQSLNVLYFPSSCISLRLNFHALYAS